MIRISLRRKLFLTIVGAIVFLAACNSSPKSNNNVVLELSHPYKKVDIWESGGRATVELAGGVNDVREIFNVYELIGSPVHGLMTIEEIQSHLGVPGEITEETMLDDETGYYERRFSLPNGVLVARDEYNEGVIEGGYLHFYPNDLPVSDVVGGELANLFALHNVKSCFIHFSEDYNMQLFHQSASPGDSLSHITLAPRQQQLQIRKIDKGRVEIVEL